MHNGTGFRNPYFKFHGTEILMYKHNSLTTCINDNYCRIKINQNKEEEDPYGGSTDEETGDKEGTNRYKAHLYY